MPECTADATWNGTLTDGDGHVALATGAWEGRYATVEDHESTDPEELLAAAQAACFAMTAAYALEEAGYTPAAVDTEATVTLDVGENGFSIPSISIAATAGVPDATAEEVAAVLERAKANCPVADALAGTDVTLAIAPDD